MKSMIEPIKMKKNEENVEEIDEMSLKIDEKRCDFQLTENTDLNDLSFVWSIFDNRPSKVSFYSTFDGISFWKLFSEDIGDMNEINKYSSCDIISNNDDIIYNYKYLIKITDDIYLSLHEFINDTSHNINNLTFYYNNDNVDIAVINNYINLLSPSLIEEVVSKVSYLIFDQGRLDIEPINNNFKYTMEENGDFYDNYPTDLHLDMNKLIKNIIKNENGVYCLYGDDVKGKNSFIGFIIDQIDKDIIIIPYNIVETFLTSLELTEVLKAHPNALFIIDDIDILYNNINNSLNGLIQVVNGILKQYISVNFLFNYHVIKKSDIPSKITQNSSDVIKFESTCSNDKKSSAYF